MPARRGPLSLRDQQRHIQRGAERAGAALHSPRARGCIAAAKWQRVHRCRRRFVGTTTASDAQSGLAKLRSLRYPPGDELAAFQTRHLH